MRSCPKNMVLLLERKGILMCRRHIHCGHANLALCFIGFQRPREHGLLYAMVIFSLSGICLSLEYNQSCKEAVNNLWQDPLKTLGVSNLRCSFLISNDMAENKRSLRSDDLKSKSYLAQQKTYLIGQKVDMYHATEGKPSFLCFRKRIIS